MGQSLTVGMGYGFAVESEGTPEEIEDFIDGLSDPLTAEFYGYSEFWTPVIIVARTHVRGWDGTPTKVETSEITHEEMGALVDALGTIAELITGHEDYDQRWSAKTGDLGWQFWSSFG